ncbi:PF13271 domain protein [Leptospira terpstrae serovar Hualin str. LT 11-33 = ATCC 700639]|uniref:PF13271 domain protein n=2 Tax=Leptospira TaxID=171 RepID=N1VUA8_9LEPT|nr:PF13271 domain protein [Leptospira terpstrae serovar Hualin str. LT 11-33 = ATCC 700639]
MLSEFNDFDKEIDENTFHACLETLATCDYYILFIGNRKGGYYDKSNNISITQREYREAYELFQRGKLRLINFVRNETLILAEKYANNKNLSSDHPDLPFISKFIDEVSRKNELELATDGKGNYPKGNWLHKFSNFEEIARVFNISLKLNTNISEKILITNLISELNENLKQILIKTDNNIFDLNNFVNNIRKNVAPNINEPSKYNSIDLRNLYFFFITKQTDFKKISTDQLTNCLVQGIFLKFDPADTSLKTSKIQNSLQNLKNQIERLQGFEKGNPLLSTESLFSNMISIKTKGEVITNNLDVTLLVMFFTLLLNISNMMKSILRFLKNYDEIYVDPILIEENPFIHEIEKIKKETIQNSEIEKWLTK